MKASFWAPSSMDTIGKRIRYIRKSLGFTQATWAEFLSDDEGRLTRGAVNNWEQGEGISASNSAKIAEKTNVSLDWLMRGQGSAPRPNVEPDMPAGPPKNLHDDDHRLLNVGVPNLLIHAGMGNGGLVEAYADVDGGGYDASQHVDGYWNFPPSVIARLSNVRRIQAFPVIGDSMTPTIKSGSIVFVDTTHRVPSPADIYALDYGDGLLIKRLKLIPRTSQIRVISDNPVYGEDILEREDVRVYGRVIGYFQWSE